MKNGIVRAFLTVHIHPLPIKREHFLFINVYKTLIDKYWKIIYIYLCKNKSRSIKCLDSSAAEYQAEDGGENPPRFKFLTKGQNE